MKKPSKEACEEAATRLEMDSHGYRQRDEVADYLRSLHEPVTEETLERWGWEKHENPSGTHYWTKPVDKPCSTCGTVGGGGRVQCPEYDKCGGDPGPCGCEMHDHGGNDVDCTVPCPTCSDSGERVPCPEDDGWACAPLNGACPPTADPRDCTVPRIHPPDSKALVRPPGATDDCTVPASDDDRGEPLPLSNDDLPRLSAEEQEVLLADLIDDNADLRSLAARHDEQLARAEKAEAELARIRPVYEAAADVVSKFNVWTTTPEGMIDDATMSAIDALCAAVEKAEEGK